MSKCENCYHYEACKSCYGASIYTLGEDIKPVRCPLFKDNSLIMELPCRVGETVYVNTLSPEKEVLWMKVTGFKIGVMYNEEDDDEMNLEELHIQASDPLRAFSIPISLLNKVVFLSREEAERALESLEEREKNEV